MHAGAWSVRTMYMEMKLNIVNMDIKEVEKFECADCGVYYWVIDRDNFDCPNCEIKLNRYE